MASTFHHRLLRGLSAIYRVMLAAYPREFRDKYGGEMARVFRDRARDVMKCGLWALAPFMLHIGIDWLATVVHERSTMEAFRKTLAVAVTALCVVSIAASGVLALSYVTLKGMADLRPLTALVLFIAQAAVTLLALNVIMFGVGLDVIALAGALGLIWLGSSMVVNALASSHFEGYAVLLGGIGVLQGGLTLMLFVWRLAAGASPRPIR